MTEKPKPRALVLGDDLGIYLAVVRSLGRRGIEVHLVAADDEAPGNESRYVSQLRTLPPYRSGPEEWVSALKALVAAGDYRLVLPCSDSDLILLERHADEIGRDRLAIANPEAASAFTDKAQTRALAGRLGVPVAVGELIGADCDAGALAARLGLPLVLKPRRSYRAGGRRLKETAQVVRSLDALAAALPAMADGGLAEAFFEGEGVGLSVVAAEGRILLAAQHRRLRTLSETGGSSVRTIEAIDPCLLADAEALSRAVGLTGPAMFEFRRNAATGEHILIEINARFWGSLPLAVAAGADFPALAWDVFTGAEAQARHAARPGITRTNLSGEFDRRTTELEAAPTVAARIRAAASLAALLPLLLAPRRFDSWAKDDPAPFRWERKELIRRMVRRAMKLSGTRPAAGPPPLPASR
jgi:predicted ATP-grasp superfamily ATP-dependent carboligase